MATENQKKPNPIVKYFKEVKGEMKKVIWPTVRQLRKNTTVVLVSILIVGLLISLLDFGFGSTLGKMVEKYGNSSTAEIAPEDQMPIEGMEGIEGLEGIEGMEGTETPEEGAPIEGQPEDSVTPDGE